MAFYVTRKRISLYLAPVVYTCIYWYLQSVQANSCSFRRTSQLY